MFLLLIISICPLWVGSRLLVTKLEINLSNCAYFINLNNCTLAKEELDGPVSALRRAIAEVKQS
jgi:hypothetical protein